MYFYYVTFCAFIHIIYNITVFFLQITKLTSIPVKETVCVLYLALEKGQRKKSIFFVCMKVILKRRGIWKVLCRRKRFIRWCLIFLLILLKEIGKSSQSKIENLLLNNSCRRFINITLTPVKMLTF